MTPHTKDKQTELVSFDGKKHIHYTYVLYAITIAQAKRLRKGWKELPILLTKPL